MKKLFSLDPSATYNAGLPKPLQPAFMFNDYHRVQLQPGVNFDDSLHNRTIPGIERTLGFYVSVEHPAVLARSKDGVTVSLLELCNELFVRGTAESFLGKSVFRVNPDLVNVFRRWERTNWKYMFQMPKFMSKDMVAAKDEIIHTFVDYFRLPYEERSDYNQFIKDSEKLAKEIGFDEMDTAKIFMLHFWAYVLPPSIQI